MIDHSTEIIIDNLYAAALDIQLWPSALHALARSIDGAGAVLLPCSLPASVLNFTSPDLIEGARVYVEEEWWRHDAPLVYTIRNNIKSGLFADSDIINPETFQANPFFNEFLTQYGSGRVTSVLSTPVPGHTIAITTHREMWRGDLSDHERLAYRRLGHHASRAAAIAIAMASSAAQAANLSDALDEVPGGIALLDQNGRVLHTTEKLKMLEKHGFAIKNGRVSVRGIESQKIIDRMIRSASLPGSVPSHDFFLLPRPSPHRPVMIRVIPVRGSTANTLEILFRGRLVMLMAVDLNVGSDPTLVRSFQALGLTLAEARLAAQIGTGRTPREAAHELGVAEATVRFQLKQVFSKLDVHRQGELTAMAAKLTLTDE